MRNSLGTLPHREKIPSAACKSPWRVAGHAERIRVPSAPRAFSGTIALCKACWSSQRPVRNCETWVYHPDLLLIGMAVSIAFALVGTVRGVRAVLKLQPAEAMREKPPERGGSILLERFPRLWRTLGFRTQMALRSAFRNRTRTLTAIVAAALSIAIMFMALAMYDALFYLVEHQFEMVAHSDVDIGMRDEKSTLALFESRELPGVDYAEPVLGLRCDLRHGRSARRITITGLSAWHCLTTPMDVNGKPIRIPSDGLVLSRKLAEVLTQRATRIAAGNPVEISGQAISDGPINGRVLRVYPAGFKKISSLGVEQQRVKVAVKLDRPPQRLGVGFRVYVRIFYDHAENAVTLPRICLFRGDGGGWQVMLVGDGRTELRPVTLGLLNDDLAEITKGLTPKDMIVTRLSREITAGMRVKIETLAHEGSQ